MLWTDLFEIMPKNKKLNDLYIKCIKEQYENFKLLSNEEKKKFYNNKNFDIVNENNLLTYNQKHDYGSLKIKE